MEPKKNTTPKGSGCPINDCLKCALCKAVNYEERRTRPHENRSEIKALYGAEVIAYNFYFLQGRAANSRAAALRQNEFVASSAVFG